MWDIHNSPMLYANYCPTCHPLSSQPQLQRHVSGIGCTVQWLPGWDGTRSVCGPTDVGNNIHGWERKHGISIFTAISLSVPPVSSSSAARASLFPLMLSKAAEARLQTASIPLCLIMSTLWVKIISSPNDRILWNALETDNNKLSPWKMSLRIETYVLVIQVTAEIISHVENSAP